MATKSISHTRHASSGSSSMAYPPVHGSPTLTNPDMILPDYDRADSPEDLPPSQSTAWRTAHTSPLDFHLPQNNYASAPVNISTPIIYGNGTMLSDIGEVTEVESTAGYGGRRSSSRYSVQSDDTLHERPALPVAKPVVTKGRSQTIARERRASIESTSTITTQENRATFLDFDDSTSIDGASCQGDDEESLASSYVEDPDIREARLAAAHEAGQNPDRYSTSSISKRAEQILANAKRRLTTMEGNLTRARSSLNSYSTISDGSTPSPPMVRPSTAMRMTGAPPSLYMRNDAATSSTQLPRSASALGAAGGYRQPRFMSKSLDSPIEGVIRPNDYPGPDTSLVPLGEEEDDGLTAGDRRDENRLSSLSSLSNLSAYSDAGLGRAASVVQVRDLQDQMNGLRGKISSLKEQARVDSMKRQSLQSLRTPSPFTHARWDQGFMEPQGIRSPEPTEQPAVAAQQEELGQEKRPSPDLPRPDQEDFAQVNGRMEADGEKQERPRSETPKQMQRDADVSDDDGTEFDDAEDWDATEVREESVKGDLNEGDYESDSGESLYHDTFQAPVSHEDREDAFDYEHFFLHSAMGTISHGRLGRSGSVSSDESVETTRGPTLADSRPGSMQTMSSVDSFATAQEGRSSRGVLYEESEEDEPLEPRRHKASKSTGQINGKSGNGSGSEGWSDEAGRPRRNSVVHRPLHDNSATMHRPSIASIESTGTNRSFPLVSKAKLNGGVLTPGGSPDSELKQISDSLMRDASNIYDNTSPAHNPPLPAMQMLSKEDRIGVERLVGSLGKCVLGLAEASAASTEARLHRRRIEAARRILEGLDENYQ